MTPRVASPACRRVACRERSRSSRWQVNVVQLTVTGGVAGLSLEAGWCHAKRWGSTRRRAAAATDVPREVVSDVPLEAWLTAWRISVPLPSTRPRIWWPDAARRRGVGGRTRHAHRSAGGGDVCGALDVVLVVDRDHLCVSGVSEALRHTRLQIEDREDADRERSDHHRHDRRHDDQFDECEPHVRSIATGVAATRAIR